MNRVKNLEHIEAKCSPLFVDYGSNRERKIFPKGSLSAYGAYTQPAFRDHRSGCSVEQYVFARYRRTLRFAQLPCLTVQRKRRRGLVVMVESGEVMSMSTTQLNA